MANKIFGKIKQVAAPLDPTLRFRVSAWDDDWPDGDDFLGQTLTDTQGGFSISCMGGIYDEGIPGLISGFPDIYITVDIKNQRDDWVRLAQSQVFKNYDLATDLRIELEVVVEPTLQVAPLFDPQEKGFHFRNNFRFRPDFLNIEFEERELGFCGGMCAATLHRYNTGEKIPDVKEIPVQGSVLYEELLNRQIRSMPPKLLAKMFRFQAATDVGGDRLKASIGQLTKKEWPKLKAQLDQKKPAILVLVRATGMYDNPTKNHQVLAIGYTFDPARQDLEIMVYDPNIPDKTNTLSMSLGLADGKLHFKDSSRRQTRGFFVSDAGEAASK